MRQRRRRRRFGRGRRCLRRGGRWRGFGGGRCRGPALGGVSEHGEARADLDGVALGDQDLGQHARGGRGNLGVDLVGRDLEQWLVERDRVPDLLEPPGDRALGDRLPQLRHRDVHSMFLPVSRAAIDP